MGIAARVGRDPSEITVSRLSTLVLTANDDETEATKDFVRQATGQDPSGSDIGTPDQLVARVEELAAAGVQYFVFNMPTGTPAMVRQVGELLVECVRRLTAGQDGRDGWSADRRDRSAP